MSRDRDALIRGLSIFVAVIIACVLAYAYQMNLPSLVHDEMSVPSLLAFVTIPLLAGFIVGIIYPEKAILDGLYVGLFSGVVNSIMAALKSLFNPEQLSLQEIYTFAVFAIISIFLWMFIAAASTLLGKALTRELGKRRNNSTIWMEKTNPGNPGNPHPPICPHYHEYLQAVSNNTAIPDACLTCTRATKCLNSE